MKLFFSIFFLFFLMSCDRNSVDDRNCRLLINIGMNHTENLTLSPLNGLSNGSSIIIYPPNSRGVIISNTGFGRYVAFDAADPNHAFEACSELTVSYPIGTCQCEDGNKFNLLDGSPVGSEGVLCPLINYRTQVTGNTLSIFN